MEAQPDLIKADIAPLLKHITPRIIADVLDELNTVGLIVLYEVKGVKCLQITEFETHQKHLRKDREAPSHIPGPTPESILSNSGPTPDLLPLKRREEKLREEKVTHADSVLLTPTEFKKLQEAIGQKNLEIGIEKLDYSITCKGGKYKDHYKTILNWNKRGYLTDNQNNGNGSKPAGPSSTPKETPYVICPACGKEVTEDMLTDFACLKCEPVKDHSQDVKKITDALSKAFKMPEGPRTDEEERRRELQKQKEKLLSQEARG